MTIIYTSPLNLTPASRQRYHIADLQMLALNQARQTLRGMAHNQFLIATPCFINYVNDQMGGE